MISELYDTWMNYFMPNPDFHLFHSFADCKLNDTFTTLSLKCNNVLHLTAFKCIKPDAYMLLEKYLFLFC